MPVLLRAALALLASCVAVNLPAADWRQFRGPHGNGVSDETGLPVSLNSERNIAWKAGLPGRGLSSPIVVGDRVFVTCSSGPRQERLHIICFNAGDGAIRWERQFRATGRTTCHEKICVAVPTPVSDGERLYAIFSSNDLLCLDRDGNLIWLRGLTRDYPDASNSLGMSSSPVVAEGVLIAQLETDGDSFAIGLDTNTGVNRWKIQRPKKANWTSPLLLKEGSHSVVVLQSSAGISAVEPATGREIWNYSDGASTIPSSARQGNVLYVPSHGVTALQPEAGGKSPRQLWRSNQLRPATASPMAIGDQVFVLNDAGVLTCGEAATGKRLWQLRLKGPFTATPVASGDHLYLVNEKGLVQVVDRTKPEGEIVGEMDLGATILGTPSLAGGAIYVRSDGRLWKISKPQP